MSQHRNPSKNSKYYIPKETFLTVVHYVKQYPMWVEQLSTMDGSKAITYDQDRVQTSPNPDTVANIAIKRAAISEKKDKVDRVAKLVGGNMSKWIIKGVCYDMPFYQLQHHGIPCGKDLYYKLRRRFYYEMSKEI